MVNVTKKTHPKEEVQSLKAQLARALADYQNLEKRVSAQRQEWAKLAGAEIILRLLPVLDTLKVAQANGVGGEGLGLAVKQFEGTLAEIGVTPILTTGKTFDPEKMDCVEAVAGEPDNGVAEETLVGYYYNDRVLRPAKVKVYKKEDNQTNVSQGDNLSR